MTGKTKTPRKGKDSGKTASAMTLIEAEALESEQFKLDTFEFHGKTLVKLTRRNVAKVEAMIGTDSAYSRSMDPTAGPEGKFKGSEAYFVSLLVEALDGRRNVDDKEYARRVRDAVAAVDRGNSTHLNADRVGVNQITKRIVEFGREELKTILKSAKLTLFEEIAKLTKKGLKRRRNISFASKFCRIICYFLFQGKPEADKYSAYDTIVKDNLPSYMEFYGVGKGTTKKRLENYKVFQSVIDEIREAAAKENGEEISRRGFDHLLWYFHKGR